VGAEFKFKALVIAAIIRVEKRAVQAKESVMKTRSRSQEFAPDSAWLLACVAAATVAAGCQNAEEAGGAETVAEPLIAQETPRGDTVAALAEPAAEHCIQEELNAIADPLERFEEAFECGDELFETEFNSLDGVGANVGDGGRFSRVPRADLNRPGQWATHVPQRATGPNGQACNHCHESTEQGSGSAGEFGDGSGVAALNVIRDPQHTAFVGQFIQRNTPHLFAIGALQRLAEEMTDELHAQRDAAREQACKHHRSVRVSLKSKGVSFGSIVVRCKGRDQLRGIDGIDGDLVVKPLQWKGNTLFVRDFNRGAGNNELGMQAVEITGDDVDGDGDGVVNEFGIGDMSALAIYNAGQPRPVSQLELRALGLEGQLGLEPLTDDQVAAIGRGDALFSRIGCASCHKPALVIDAPIFSEPSQSPFYRDAVFPAGQDPVARGVDPANPITFDLTLDQPDNVFEIGGEEVRLGTLEANDAGGAIVRLFGDLKRHDMGPGLAENIDETGTGASVWLTKELWGVGSTGPYLHDGRATTLAEAILEHGGEAAASRRRFQRLPTGAQADIVAFLENLILIKI
jgi:cytochrome c peroxidase